MANNQPFLKSDADRWLYGVLSVDPLLQSYAPGGFWSEHPDQVQNKPWEVTAVYGFGDRVVGSDGQYYHSLQNSNSNNDPTTSASWWALNFPCVRWWMQSPGRDIKAQDGKAGRVQSCPVFIVCMLDRQHGGTLDTVQGTNGHLEDGARRLYVLLSARTETVVNGSNTFRFSSFQTNAYQMIEPHDGDYDVMVGSAYQIYAQ